MGLHFKPYHQHQLSLLPQSLDELIDAQHPVRLVNTVIDQIDIDVLLEGYKTRGESPYHPRMLLKVLVYGYLNNTYSSRKLEASLKENIHFMWLSGGNKPDHNTINRFRGERLKHVVKEVFGQVVLLLYENGQLDLKRAFVDGTKLEANANRYTFIWGKSIKRNRNGISKQLEELWNYAESVAAHELADSRPQNFEAVDPDAVNKTIEQISEALKKNPKASKNKQQKANYAKRNWPDNIAKYNDQEQKLAGRNSCSKTDNDATFMRMKDDHMRNGQLKPAYNLQISTNDQFILNYSLHQTTSDTTTLEDHLRRYSLLYNLMPEELVADAGYGSEQNYELLEKNEIDAYVKYAGFHAEQKQKKSRKAEKRPFRPEKLFYNKEQDAYYCPIGQRMDKVGVVNRKNKRGYKQQQHVYQAKNCEGCPMAASCKITKKTKRRRIEVNHRWLEQKGQMREKLLSEKGIELRKKRPADVEAVFGQLKHNWKFNRLMLRGLDKVDIEIGLLAIAHNLAKSVSKA